MSLDSTTIGTDHVSDMAPPEAASQASEVAATSATPAKTPKSASTISGSTLTIIGGPGAGQYSTTEMPPASIAGLAMLGLRYALVNAKDPATVYADLQKGVIPGRVPAAAKELDPWRQAIAHATADAEARSQGIKANPGKKLVDHPDYKMLLENAMQRAAGVDREKLARAKTLPDVVAHYQRIIGGTGSAADLLGEVA